MQCSKKGIILKQLERIEFSKKNLTMKVVQGGRLTGKPGNDRNFLKFLIKNDFNLF